MTSQIGFKWRFFFAFELILNMRYIVLIQLSSLRNPYLFYARVGYAYRVGSALFPLRGAHSDQFCIFPVLFYRSRCHYSVMGNTVMGKNLSGQLAIAVFHRILVHSCIWFRCRALSFLSNFLCPSSGHWWWRWLVSEFWIVAEFRLSSAVLQI